MIRSLLLAAVICLSAHAAPVPKEKPKGKPAVPGLVRTWDCCWGSDWDSEMAFNEDGTYHHKYHSGSLWLGTWHRAGDGSLVVKERLVSKDPAAAPGQWMYWNVTEKWDGSFYFGTAGGDHGTVKWIMRKK